MLPEYRWNGRTFVKETRTEAEFMRDLKVGTRQVRQRMALTHRQYMGDGLKDSVRTMTKAQAKAYAAKLQSEIDAL